MYKSEKDKGGQTERKIRRHTDVQTNTKTDYVRLTGGTERILK